MNKQYSLFLIFDSLLKDSLHPVPSPPASRPSPAVILSGSCPPPVPFTFVSRCLFLFLLVFYFKRTCNSCISLTIDYCFVFTDYILWLKSLRLHKYYPLFSKITYDAMFNLADKELEAKVRFLDLFGHD